MDDLDGFYTFLVGMEDGFAVLRDPIACKPAVLAETDDWVAMASEWRSIAQLPGAAEARSWEPAPGVYAWSGRRSDGSRGGEIEAAVEVVDLAATPLRRMNQRLHDLATTPGPRHWRVLNPNGAHAVACGLDADVEVEIDGHVGYYCAGMNKLATVRVREREHRPRREHDVRHGRDRGQRQPVGGATGHGGLLVVQQGCRTLRDLAKEDRHRRGDPSRHLSGFMAQTGRLVVRGDAGEALGDSIYEARLYVRGSVAGLGADRVEKELREEHRAELAELLGQAGFDHAAPSEFRRQGSARQLYTFKVDNASAY